MNLRSCRDFAEARSAYVDGYLGEAERQALLRHLSDCAACRDEVAELQRLRILLTDTGRTPTPMPAQLSDRLAAIATATYDPPGHRIKVVAPMSAAGVVLLLMVIAGVGYVAAPAERARVADPTAAVRADFSAAIDELPLTNPAVSAALLVDPDKLRTAEIQSPADPAMRGPALTADQITALLHQADRASDRLARTGVVRVLAPRDHRSTAADVTISTEPGIGSRVVVRSLSGAELTRGLIPSTPGQLDDDDQLQAMASAYQLSGVSGGTLLGRPVSLVEARRHGSPAGQPAAARWWIDDATGLILRQQNYDHAGRLVVSVGYRSLRLGRAVNTAAIGSPSQLAAPLLGSSSTTAAFSTASAVRLTRQGWFCHAELAGMALSRLQADAPTEPGVVHMVYTDGLSTVSVFERRGLLADSSAESRWDPTLGAYRNDALLNTASWQSGGAVFTVATDGSTALRDRVVAALPHDDPDGASTMARVRAGWARILDSVG
ncbi:hypothetical protein FOE78_19640 [Microlunatus elymi]|uniref:Putative zinc-finger domain-containing protein n=1 Tax=Microlunatus elymi TaxID=2596828 RepID=A0A516Q315_9ACTN|nr:zf-HC2 domain-containing protein [Microlunatus elymi]QDP97825.1 hypothetical protein FOE78_19640 [Microlunatus elymi]